MTGQRNFIGISNWHSRNNPIANNKDIDVFPVGNILFGSQQSVAVEEGKRGAPATSFVGGVRAGGLYITGEGVHFEFTKHQFKKHRC